MPITTCARAAGAMAMPASNAAVPIRVLIPRMCDPLKVSVVPKCGRDDLMPIREPSGNCTRYKGVSPCLNSRDLSGPSLICPYMAESRRMHRPRLSNRNHSVKGLRGLRRRPPGARLVLGRAFPPWRQEQRRRADLPHGRRPVRGDPEGCGTQLLAYRHVLLPSRVTRPV